MALEKMTLDSLKMMRLSLDQQSGDDQHIKLDALKVKGKDAAVISANKSALRAAIDHAIAKKTEGLS